MAKEEDRVMPEEMEETENPASEQREGIGEGAQIQFETDQVAIAVEALRLELVESQSKAEEYLDGWQRARAEFANYKKRMEREQAQAYQMAAGNILKRYLEVLDDLERALKNRPVEAEGQAWSNGIELIYNKLLNILENEGVKPFQAQGQSFDPNFHEAVTSEESDQHASGQIIEVLQQGYLLGDRVLRPAMVRVAR